MARAYDAFLSLNIGGSNAQLDDYAYSAEPIVKEGKGRTGTKVKIDGRGFVDGGPGAGGAAAMGSGVAELVASLSRSGQNVIVSEFGGALLAQILAARCVEGGPHITFGLLPNLDGAPHVKKFSFSAQGEQKLGDGQDPNEPDNAYKLRVTTGPDDVRRVEITGEITGAGATAHYRSKVLPAFLAAYPVAQWVPKHSVERNQADDKASYQVSFEELTQAYPAGGATTAVDGEATQTVERDEQQRLLRHYNYQFLCDGDPQPLLDALRPNPPGDIVRESAEITYHKGRQLHATFTMLESGSANALLDYTASLSKAEGYPTVTEAAYPGLPKPFLIRNPQAAYSYTFRGRAVAIRKYLKAPEPVLPFLAAKPVVNYSQLSEFEYETTWEHQYLSIDRATFALTKLKRPDQPQYEN